MNNVYHDGTTRPPSHWWGRHYLVGNAQITPTDTTLRLVTRQTSHTAYSNAQLDDNHSLPRRYYAWRPPLRLQVRARLSHSADQLQGTAGFGFWNYPINRHQLPTLPRAIWFFFAAPPANMKLDLATPGYGWKAATLDALRPGALLLAPWAPLAVALMQAPTLYRWLWPRIQRALGVGEAAIHTSLNDWHIYTLDWGPTTAHFFVDGQPVLENAPAPRGPLCFVTWVDNQYAIATPQGRFGWGLLDIPEQQWLEIDWLAIERTSQPVPTGRDLE